MHKQNALFLFNRMLKLRQKSKIDLGNYQAGKYYLIQVLVIWFQVSKYLTMDKC